MFADIYGLVAAQAAGLQLSAEAQAAADGEIGILVGGSNLVPLSLSQAEIFNSVWSTDGVHPNGRGAALVANEIIRVINEKYGSSIPTVNPLDYPGINAPF
jgi:lysophospholipase L1-like esterase